MPFPPELRRYLLLVVAVSVLAAAGGCTALFFALSPDQALSTQSRIVLGLFAIVILPIATFGLFFVPRWYRRARRVVDSTTPVPAFAVLTLDGADLTSLRAAISMGRKPEPSIDQVSLLTPRWNVRALLGGRHSVGLFIDPSNSRLMALSTDHGMLWCMPVGNVVRVTDVA